MGGGKSPGLFEGTRGSIARPDDSTSPIRARKARREGADGIGGGIGGAVDGGSSKPRRKNQISIAYILQMIARYYTGKISDAALVRWILQISTSPAVQLSSQVEEALTAALREWTGIIREDGSYDEISFKRVLASLEKKLRSIK